MIAEFGHDVVAEPWRSDNGISSKTRYADGFAGPSPFVALGCISARHHTEPPIDP